MTFRCNRLGNLFVKRVWIEILCISLPFLIIGIGGCLLVEWVEWWSVFIVLLIPMIVSIILLMQYPREFTYEAKRLIWTESLRIQNDAHDICKTVVTVGDLHVIELMQTPIERLFNIGRICFMGDIRSLEAPKKVERPIIPFYYGGICEFDRFKECLHQNLPQSAFLH